MVEQIYVASTIMFEIVKNIYLNGQQKRLLDISAFYRDLPAFDYDDGAILFLDDLKKKNSRNRIDSMKMEWLASVQWQAVTSGL